MKLELKKRGVSRPAMIVAMLFAGCATDDELGPGGGTPDNGDASAGSGGSSAMGGTGGTTTTGGTGGRAGAATGGSAGTAGGTGGSIGGSAGSTGGNAGTTGGTGGSTAGTGASSGTSGTGGSTGGAAGTAGGTGGAAGTAGGTGGFGGSSGGCPTSMVTIPTQGGGMICIDAHEVSAAEYQAFLDSSPSTAGQPAQCAFNSSFAPKTSGGSCNASSYDPAGRGSYPVVCVNWCDAVAYCAWAGKHLCGNGASATPYNAHSDWTQSDWFNACSKGNTQLYPYGPSYNGSLCVGADFDGTPGYGVTDIIQPVDRMPNNCEGGYPELFEMSGNVHEWENCCNGTSGASDECRIRGGSVSETNGISSFRYLGCNPGLGPPGQARDGHAFNIGFRCCK